MAMIISLTARQSSSTGLKHIIYYMSYIGRFMIQLMRRRKTKSWFSQYIRVSNLASFFSALRSSQPTALVSTRDPSPFPPLYASSWNLAPTISLAHDHFSAASRMTFSVGFPAPWPALTSIRHRRGFGFDGNACWSAAASLKECAGTTRSSSGQRRGDEQIGRDDGIY